MASKNDNLKTLYVISADVQNVETALASQTFDNALALEDINIVMRIKHVHE